MSKIDSLAPVDLASKVHPGFHFRHSLRLLFVAVLSVLKGLIIVPMGTMGPFLLADNPFKTLKGLVNYV